ncbi:hypothetical protein [Campylobacter upsaliensis]|uniref:hypothetical protein n=1 Tax=Campylobacter upsaliensis TaxID=28080 RepID=UPI0022EA99D9|nr:hypothetical protein [Campylobacter upsaliensis]MEB2791367.1 hypothetical protein [Campylobacter upsaliensis]
MENPPYAQTNSNKEGGINSKYQKTWVHTQMQKGGEDLESNFAFLLLNTISLTHIFIMDLLKFGNQEI